MIDMSTPVTFDVPPFERVFGTTPRLRGVTRVALKRIASSEAFVDALGNIHAEGALELDRLLEDPLAAGVRPSLERCRGRAGGPTASRAEASLG